MRLFDVGAREGPEVVHDKVLTAANGITVLRLAGLPLFVWLLLARDSRAAAFWTMVVVASTDWVDGYVARRFNQITRIGKVIDPMVDRLLLATAAITLLLAGFLPWGVLAAIVGRDVVMFAGVGLLLGRVPPIVVTRTGKFATACLMIGLPSFLVAAIDWPGAGFARWVAWGYTVVGVVTYWVAGTQYLRAAARQRRLERD